MTRPEPSLIRRTCHYSGRVQGVGFRYTVEAIARRLPVTGYVRNLADGRVELVVEGAADAVTPFLDAVARAMKANVTRVECTESPASSAFTDFRIAF